MPLYAKGALIMWHDIDPAGEAEWHRWHTVEHMHERVSIPGFMAGRRYMSDDVARQRVFMIYEGADISVFNSAPYLERLNNPTPWSRKVMPLFQNFMRGACRVVATAGSHAPCPELAGHVLSLQLAGTAKGDVQAKADALVETFSSRDTVIGAHLLICERAVTNVETTERKARSATKEEQFDGALVIEGYNRKALAALRSDAEAALVAADIGFAAQAGGVYDLAYYIRAA